MGFYNIYTEGRQAEEYKARKTKEAEEKEKDENIRSENRTKLQRSAMIGTQLLISLGITMHLESIS